MAFHQDPPRLRPQYDDDPLFVSMLERLAPPDLLAAHVDELRHLGALSAGPLYDELLRSGGDEPTLVPWDPWGHRVDHIELTPLWKRVARLAAEHGLVATGYDRSLGGYARLLQFAKVYLLEPSTGFYACPLAMTDGAARTLLASGNEALIARAVPRLLSRDPDAMWTSGQWMTERTGGSDVAICETVAVPDGDVFRLHGTKWFTSATTSQMALTLGRPEGNPPGGAGLALFYVELRDEAGRMHGIRVNRLKDKLGTRMVPTAELTLEGAVAIPVRGHRDGIRNITPMLAVTRTWNAVGAIAGMRRALALALDYAHRRVQFGGPLVDKPLHRGVLADLACELAAATALTLRLLVLLGREESGEADDDERALLRLLTPLAKLCTGKQAVAVASEALEAFGGAGYVEDTGLPRLLRDAQVLPIWEGTTNVLSLDVLRALSRGTDASVLVREAERALAGAAASPEAEVARAALGHAVAALARGREAGPSGLEEGARRIAMTAARSLALALLVEHAAWADARGDRRATHAARRFARLGVDLVHDVSLDDEARGVLGLA